MKAIPYQLILFIVVTVCFCSCKHKHEEGFFKIQYIEHLKYTGGKVKINSTIFSLDSGIIKVPYKPKENFDTLCFFNPHSEHWTTPQICNFRKDSLYKFTLNLCSDVFNYSHRPITPFYLNGIVKNYKGKDTLEIYDYCSTEYSHINNDTLETAYKIKNNIQFGPLKLISDCFSAMCRDDNYSFTFSTNDGKKRKDKYSNIITNDIFSFSFLRLHEDEKGLFFEYDFNTKKSKLKVQKK